MKIRVNNIELEPLERNLIVITIESKEVTTTNYLPIKAAKKLSDSLLVELKNL